MGPTETDPTFEPDGNEVQEQEYVELYQASDEDLDAFLNSPLEEEGFQDEEVEPEPELPQGQPKQEAPKKQEGESIEERLAKLEAENAKLKSQNRDQSSFIGRRATEIGELRAQLRQAHAQLEQRLTEEEDTLPPREVAKLQSQIEKIESRDRELEGEQALEQARATVKKFVQPWQDMNQDIAAVLLSDGIPEEQVVEFVRNPYQYASGTEIVHLAQRAKATRIANELIKQNQELRAQLAAKNPKQNGTAKVVENLRTASQPGVNGVQSRRTQSNQPVSRNEIARLSDAELERLLK